MIFGCCISMQKLRQSLSRPKGKQKSVFPPYGLWWKRPVIEDCFACSFMYYIPTQYVLNIEISVQFVTELFEAMSGLQEKEKNV